MDARSRRRLAGSLSALLLCFLVPRAGAQYMYLDSNGDGVHTKADVVSPHGTTRIAVWLITDRNRDGTKVPCSTEATLTGYRLLLVATNGTVRWGTFVPDPPVGTNYEAQPLDSQGCAAWYGLPAPLPAGKHRLGTVTLAVVRGTPSVAILPAPGEYPQQGTRFFSGCSDPGLTMEHVLENDWHDVDGLMYRGRANTPPVLSARATFPVRAGWVAAYHIQAHDKDGDPVTFRAVPREGIEPPSFIRVRTVDAGRGEAVGAVEITADSCAEGEWLFNIEASDGISSDRKEARAPVERVDRPVPANPMGPPRTRGVSTPARISTHDMSPSKAALIGDWEWTESPPSRIAVGSGLFRSSPGPITEGARRRLVLGGYGDYEMYRIAAGTVSRVESGKYSLGDDRGRKFIVLAPFETGERKYAIWKSADDTLCLYPWGANDASADHYVSVPYWVRHGNHLDTLAVLEPLGPPEINPNGSLTLRASLRGALRRFDSGFRPYNSTDWTAPGNIVYGDDVVPWAVVGDFDGDLIQDIALYGQSGKDEVVLAVLSGYSNTRVVEVARRPATSKWPHPYLELVPRGTKYDPCWARKGAPDTDAIGIVSPGVARFDYALSNGKFIVYAPVP